MRHCSNVATKSRPSSSPYDSTNSVERILVRLDLQAAERVDVDGLARLDPGQHERDDRLVRKAGELGEHGADRPAGRVPRERPEHQLVLAVRGPDDLSQRPVHPARRHVVTFGEGGEGDRGDPAVAVARQRDDVLDRELGVGEQLDRLLVGGVLPRAPRATSPTIPRVLVEAARSRARDVGGASLECNARRAESAGALTPRRTRPMTQKPIRPRTASPTSAQIVSPTLPTLPRSQRLRQCRATQPSAWRISSSSGKRPSTCFEKTSFPSATTSNWLFSPGTIPASWSLLALIAAARLVARVS